MNHRIRCQHNYFIREWIGFGTHPNVFLSVTFGDLSMAIWAQWYREFGIVLSAPQVMLLEHTSGNLVCFEPLQRHNNQEHRVCIWAKNTTRWGVAKAFVKAIEPSRLTQCRPVWISVH
jgi:hypothetical protein